MTTATLEAVKCDCCGEPLDDEEAESPRIDKHTGKPICDECYHEHFEFECQWCEESDEKDREMAIGSLCVILQPTPCDSLRLYGASSPHWLRIGDDYRSHMMPGVYRVVRWPVYCSNMLSEWLYADAFEWFSPLPDVLKGGEHWYHAGGLCRSCQWKLKHAKWRKGWTGR